VYHNTARTLKVTKMIFAKEYTREKYIYEYINKGPRSYDIFIYNVIFELLSRCLIYIILIYNIYYIYNILIILHI